MFPGSPRIHDYNVGVLERGKPRNKTKCLQTSQEVAPLHLPFERLGNLGGEAKQECLQVFVVLQYILVHGSYLLSCL